MIAGRFVYKRRQKARTAYAVTSERVLVAVGESNMTDGPIKHQPMQIRRSRDGRHVSVLLGSGPGTARPNYGNSGLDFFGSTGSQIGLYDVSDAEGLMHALDVARASSWAGGFTGVHTR